MTIAAVTSSAGWPGYEWQNALARRPAYAVDQTLPDQAFGVWLRDEVFARLPKMTSDHGGFEPCVDAPNDCVTFMVDIPSRARSMELRFDRERFQFLEGEVGGSELERMPPIKSLAKFPERLRRPMRPLPLSCPDGAVLRLKEEHAGLTEWCETPERLKHGPARAWFNTGIYLMHRGNWSNGAKTGKWLECDRFERCRRTDYGG